MPTPISSHLPNPPKHPGTDLVESLSRLGDDITQMAAHLDAGTFQLLKLIGEFDEKGGWHGIGINSCAHWLNWKCGISLGPAREKVRVARALPGLPKISKAFRAPAKDAGGSRDAWHWPDGRGPNGRRAARGRHVATRSRASPTTRRHTSQPRRRTLRA